jgi:hypothetical protein
VLGITTFIIIYHSIRDSTYVRKSHLVEEA